VDVQLFGMNAGSHHLTNVLFHIINTLLLLIIAWGVPELVARWRHRKTELSIIAATFLSILTATTLLQRYWTNSITLFGHALHVTTNNYIVFER